MRGDRLCRDGVYYIQYTIYYIQCAATSETLYAPPKDDEQQKVRSRIVVCARYVSNKLDIE